MEAGPSFCGEEVKNQKVAEDEGDSLDEDEHQESITSFTPGPLLSLKDQFEKDKVFIFLILYIYSAVSSLV